jgi:hypothetical protein
MLRLATRSGAGSRATRQGGPSLFEEMNVANVYVERKGRIEGDYDGA